MQIGDILKAKSRQLPQAIAILKKLEKEHGIKRVFFRQDGEVVCRGFVRAHWTELDREAIVQQYKDESYEIHGDALVLERLVA